MEPPVALAALSLYSSSIIAKDRLMTSETADTAYPPLDTGQMDAMNARLVEIIALRHPGLTPAQMADLTAAIAQQTENLEALHRFPLKNSDEPAFIRAPFGTVR
jgi:hypothetical protein